MVTAPLSMLFGSIGVFYGILLPVLVVQIMALFFMPCLLNRAGKPEEIGKAVFCYMVQGFGIVLMALGGLPTIFSVLARQSLPTATYAGLLFVFAAGGLAFLWHDYLARGLDPAARAVPAAICHYSWRFVGFVLTVLSTLSMVLRMLLGSTLLYEGWWVMHTVVLLFGLILLWATAEEMQASQSGFKSTIMAGKQLIASAKKKTARAR